MTTARPPAPRGILVDFVAWLFLAMLLVTVGMLAANVWTIRRNTERHLQQQAHDLAHQIAPGVADAAWNLDPDALAAHFAHGPWAALDITGIRVTSEFGDPIFTARFADAGAPVVGRAPVHHGNTLVGFIEVARGREAAVQRRDAIIRALVLHGLAALPVILLVCLWMVRHSIVTPARRAITALRRVAAGDPAVALPAGKHREFAEIYRAITAMAADIAARQQQLQQEISERRRAEAAVTESNRQLESRIAERTDRLRRMAVRLASAQDREQQRIAEGLHDDVAQLVAAARIKLQAAIAAAAGDPAAQGPLRAMEELVGTAYERVRLLSFELASSSFYRQDLRASLLYLCNGMNRRYAANFVMTDGADPLPAVDEAAAALLFKAARELLFNVVKHAGTKDATLSLRARDDGLALSVADRGGAMALARVEDLDPARGLGLFSIRERLQDVGGALTIAAVPGVSTTLTVTIPAGAGKDHP